MFLTCRSLQLLRKCAVLQRSQSSLVNGLILPKGQCHAWLTTSAKPVNQVQIERKWNHFLDQLSSYVRRKANELRSCLG
jgi:hypothetical protein